MSKLISYYKSIYSQLSFGIRTGDEDFDKPCNELYLTVYKWSWSFRLPNLIKPRTKWIDLSKAPWAQNNPEPRGYTEIISKNYGFTIYDNTLFLYYGIQPGCRISNDRKNSDHTFVWFFPWTQTRHIRHDLYYPDGTFFANVENEKTLNSDWFKRSEELTRAVPKIRFQFCDFDGEVIEAECYISEREWHHGIGWFKWLSLFRKPIISRCLEISFNKEVGYEKGSWKGGAVGHSIELRPNELPYYAFYRYGHEYDNYKYHGRKMRGFYNIKVLS